jgi:ParB family chromosome partitioning protein
MATRWTVFPDTADPPRAVAALAEQVTRDGGHVLACYQEPLKDAWQLFVLLPLARVEPTPYQRDLSKPHVKRLQDVIKKRLFRVSCG